MILVKIKLEKSRIHGLGVFANQFIPKGTLVWKFDPTFDLIVKEHVVDAFPEIPQEDFLTYAYQSKITRDYVLCSDNSKFVNHDPDANVRCIISEDQKNNDMVCFALRDINIDDEITNNYVDFEVDVSDVTSETDYGKNW